MDGSTSSAQALMPPTRFSERLACWVQENLPLRRRQW